MSNPRDRGQEELQNRLKKLREQKDIIAGVIEDMMQRVELAASRAASVTNMNEFLCHFVAATGSMDQMYIKMFQVHVLLTAEEAYGWNADCFRAPRALTFPASNDENGAQGLGSPPSISRPPSVALPDLSVCDEVHGPRPALVRPQESQKEKEKLYAAPRGQHQVSASPAYKNPGTPSTVRVSPGPVYPVPGSPLAHSLSPASVGGPGTQALLAASPPTLVCGDHGPQQEFMVPPPGTGRSALPEVPSPPTSGCESPDIQLMIGIGRGNLPELPLPPTPAYPSPGAKLATKPKLTTAPMAPGSAPGTRPPSEGNLPLATMHMRPMAPPTDSAQVAHVETPSCSATSHAEALKRALPAAKSVAPSSVQSATTIPQESAEGAVKEDVRDRGDARLCLYEADRVNNNYNQPQGERKPADGKAGVSVPPGFTTSHRQPRGVMTSTKALSPGNSSSQEQSPNTVTAGCVKSQSPGSYKYFSIPPADTSIIGTTQKVVLSFYKNPSEFWLQLESSGEVLDNLVTDMFEYYEANEAHQEFEASVGMHCVAHYAMDNHWYRAKILELRPDHAKVSYVDFGNCDRVALKELCLLTEQFASLPAQAHYCSIKGLLPPGSNKQWPIPAVRQFRNMLSADEVQLEAVVYLRDSITGRLIVDIFGKTGDGPVVNLSQEFITICTTEALRSFKAPEGPTAQQPPAVEAPAAGGPPGSEPSVIASPDTTEQSAATPCAPSCQVGGETCRDGMVSVPISASAEAVPGMPPVHVPVPPATAILATGPPATEPPVAAPPSVTPAAVPDVAKPAAPRSPVKPPAGAPSAKVLMEGALARLSHKPPPPGVIHTAPPPPVNVSWPPLPPGAAHPPLPTVDLLPGIPPAALPDGKTFTFMLSVVFNPSDFYGQILTPNSTPQMLEELQQQLNRQGSASSPPPVASVTKGTFWICFYPGDKNWYRAQVLDTGNTHHGWRARVLYVDYGNRSVVQLKNLRPLPEFLAKPPACAHRMTLALVNPSRGNKWAVSATKTFVNETGFKTVLVAEKRGQRQAGLETITEVVLWNKNGARPVNINILLVEKNLAQLKSS